MSAGDRKPGETLECHRCHRIGTRGFVPWGSEGWECSNDRACTQRLQQREKPTPGRCHKPNSTTTSTASSPKASTTPPNSTRPTRSGRKTNDRPHEPRPHRTRTAQRSPQHRGYHEPRHPAVEHPRHARDGGPSLL
ncbi:hypothetical protein D514_0118655 [Microbacterium sp. UCD-TDU]|nr:hypothetical protein D514_0118655 [Microbacterium sp. UCD-TDU]